MFISQIWDAYNWERIILIKENSKEEDKTSPILFYKGKNKSESKKFLTGQDPCLLDFKLKTKQKEDALK